jgi:hypothetical protein
VRHTKPLRANSVVIGLGAGIDPTTLEAPGTTGQVLTAVTGGKPVFAAPATVNLTTGVTGILPVANGGTGQAVGAISSLMFFGTAVPVGTTTFLGRDDDTTEANVRYVTAFAGTVLTLAAIASVQAGAAQSYVYTLRIAGADTALVLTLAGTGLGGITGAAQGTIAFIAGQAITVKLVTSAGAGVANHQVSLALRADG